MKPKFWGMWRSVNVKAVQMLLRESSTFISWLTLAMKLKVKCTVHPITGDKGLEGEQWYSSTLSLTSHLMRVGSQHHALATLPWGRRPATHCIGPRGPLGQSGQVHKISPLPGFDPWNVQPVVSCNTNWAIPNCPPNNTASPSQRIYNVRNTNHYESLKSCKESHVTM